MVTWYELQKDHRGEIERRSELKRILKLPEKLSKKTESLDDQLL